MRSSTLAALLVLAAAGAAQAVVVSPIADLTDGVARTGNFVSGVNNFDDPATWRVYTLSANAGDSINVRVSRMIGACDPIAFAHLGDLSGADLQPGDDASDLSGYGLTFLALGDDNVDDGFGGPFGDPSFGFTATATGAYTIITHMYGDYPNNPAYEIQARGSTAPAPGALALLGVGGLIAARRRRTS